jgi:sugar/nucleoside kinase (ribokinase family)
VALDLVVLGNLLVDDVVLPDGRTRMAEPGGAVLYVALGAWLWGLRVGIVSVRGDEYPAEALQTLAERGIALDGVAPLGRPGLRTWLLYEGARRRVVHRLDGPTHAEMSPTPEAIPAGWRDARAFHLAPMPFDVQQALVTALPSGDGRLVSLDPYVLLRPDTLAEWQELLSRIDALFLSEDEMELEGPDALRGLTGGRLKTVVFKQGAAGGALFDATTARLVPWRPRAAAVVDPTGAGDVFAAGVLAGWLRGESHERAIERGIVGASFAIEDWGPAGIFRATPDAAEARRREWFG